MTIKRHEERMKSDPAYRVMAKGFERFHKEIAQEANYRQRHYDRDGYCDNPARGY